MSSILSKSYPNVERITVKYKVDTASAFSEEANGVIVIGRDDELSVKIPCTNKTCRDGYIDVTEEVKEHLYHKEISFTFDKMCRGRESDNISARRCIVSTSCSCRVQYLS